MLDFLNKFKIPTILGLSVILMGTIAGVVLVVMGNQTLTTQASPDQIPKDITLSNANSSSITISWTTTAVVPGFVTYGVNMPSEQTALDDRDSQKPSARNIHYVTIKNLTPQTTYQFKIISGKLTYPEILKFTTATPSDAQSGYKPIIGTALQNNQPVQEGLVYLSVSGAYLQSALIKNLGSFIIPINNLQNTNLTGMFQPVAESNAKITAVSTQGKGSAVFKLTNSDKSIGTIRIGENLDFTFLPIPTIQPQVTPELLVYDLNSDGFVNVNDYSLVLKNFGRNPSEKKADINKDGIVDKKDLDLISKQITPTPSPNTKR